MTTLHYNTCLSYVSFQTLFMPIQYSKTHSFNLEQTLTSNKQDDDDDNNITTMFFRGEAYTWKSFQLDIE